ncbi:MAG TPA: hypothetical protein ENF93_01380, partial [Ignisphaera sp.]|nr:hypothetical protein [Ignisphaera sp.]
MKYIAMKIASGKRGGFKAIYYVDGIPKITRIENKAEINIVSDYRDSENRYEIVLEGFIRPPFAGNYVFIVDAKGDVVLLLEGKQIQLNKQKHLLVSHPIFLTDTGLYRLKLRYLSKGPILKLKLSWLRDDGVLETLNSNYSSIPSSSSIIFRGVKDNCMVI